MKSKKFWQRGQTRRDDFNGIAIPLSESDITESHNRNGYFLCAEGWGTCFFKTANTENFAIWTELTGTARTYTTIPSSLYEDVYWVSMNWKNNGLVEPAIQYPEAARLVGLHDPIPHQTKGWITQTALVYSPNGKPTAHLTLKGQGNIPPVSTLAAGK